MRGIHPDVRARHTLACHFATFAGSDAEALEPLVELEWAKRAGATWDGKRGLVVRELSSGNGDGDDARDGDVKTGLIEEKYDVGDWMDEGGFGWIDVGETAEIPLESEAG